MSFDVQENMYNQQLANFNADVTDYTNTVNQFRADAEQQQQQNEAIASLLENTGIFGLDVVSKIVQSKAFAYLTTAVMRSGVLDNLKPYLKTAVKRSLGIDLDEPSNFAWKKTFEQLDLSKAKDIYQAIKSGDVEAFKSIMKQELVKVVANNAPEIAKQSLKVIGVDLEKPEFRQYLAQIKASNIQGDDLISAAQGDFKPLLTKIAPVVKSIVVEKVSQDLKLPQLPAGEPSPFTEALKSLSIDDVQKALKGDYTGVSEKLAPVVKSYVQDKIQEKFGINLKSTGESTLESPLSFDDIKRAISGDYNGIIDSLKPQVQKVVQNKIKELTGLDIDPTKSPVTLEDLQNISQRNYQPVINKFLPQAEKYVKSALKEHLGIDIEKLSNQTPTTPFTMDDYKALSRGDYQVLVNKYKPQLEQYVAQKLNIPVDTSTIPISIDDIKELSRGNYQPVLEKYKPQVQQYVQGKLKEATGLYFNNVIAQSPLSIDDLQNISKGNYQPVLEKYKPQLEKYIKNKINEQLGINIDNLSSQTPTTPFNMDDYKALSRGDYKVLVDKYKPQLERYASQKLQENLKLPLDLTTTPLEINDFRELAKGNYDPLITKYKPQVEKYVTQKIKETYGIPLDTSQAPITGDDLKLLSQGKFKPLLVKYEPQVKDYFTNKLKEITGLNIDLNPTSPIYLNDIKEFARGNYQPILSKFKPQIREQVTNHLRDNLGVDVNKYESQLSTLGISDEDLISAGKGDYSRILGKLQTKVELETGVLADDLQTAMTQAKQQAIQFKRNAKTAVQQVRTQAETAVQQVRTQAETAVQQARTQAETVGQQVRTQAQQVETQATRAIDVTTQSARTATTNPDVFTPFREPNVQINPLAGPAVTEAATSIRSQLGRTIGQTAETLGAVGSQLAVGFGAGNIQNEPARDVTQVLGSGGSAGILTAGSSIANGDTALNALAEGASAGVEMGTLAGVQLATSYIPDKFARFAANTATNVAMTGSQLSGVIGGSSAGASAGADIGTELAGVGADLATAEVASAPVDAVPVVGEVVQGAIGLAALGASIYFGIKDLFDNSHSAPPPPPTIGEASIQIGV